MRKLFFLFILSPALCLGKDCADVKPFIPNGTLNSEITVSRFYWKNDKQLEEDVCKGKLSLSTYDVRGREEEAFYCLRPKQTEILTCKTNFNNQEAEMFVLPASWIRTWKPKDAREYRFHSYVTKKIDSSFYYDIFSRSLSFNLDPEDQILEGALKTGPNNSTDGYFIRVQFSK